ncbi:MAG: pirin family protein [Flavobacteriales bacterium]
MNRKDFLKKGLTRAGVLATAGVAAAVVKNNIDPEGAGELQPIDAAKQVGFNHLPNPETVMTNNMIIHKADSRGKADYGWLKTNYSFSFSNYYNPERMNFGVLRVLNDDVIAGGMGFGTHPHDNMEIITIPLEGAVEHKDSMGNSGTIPAGEVQVMSAGTGIYHSEFNHIKDSDLKLLQLWVFPNKANVTPRYDQIKLKPEEKNILNQILSPSADDDGVWIHQNAWFHIGTLEKDVSTTYTLKDGVNNGVYVFIIDGEACIGDVELGKRDALGIWSVNELSITPMSEARVLLIEVPMKVS